MRRSRPSGDLRADAGDQRVQGDRRHHEVAVAVTTDDGRRAAAGSEHPFETALVQAGRRPEVLDDPETPRRIATSRMSSAAQASIWPSLWSPRRVGIPRVGRQPGGAHGPSCGWVDAASMPERVSRRRRDGGPGSSTAQRAPARASASGGQRVPGRAVARPPGRQRRLPRALGPVVEPLGQPPTEPARRFDGPGRRRPAPEAPSTARR